MAIDGGGAAYTRFAEEMDIDTLDLKVRDNYSGYGRWPAVRRWCSEHRKTLGLFRFCLVPLLRRDCDWTFFALCGRGALRNANAK